MVDFFDLYEIVISIEMEYMRVHTDLKQVR